MKFGTLNFDPVEDHLDLVAEPVRQALKLTGTGILVAEIDPTLSDTAVFCEHYGIAMGVTANCVVIAAKRADRVWNAACLVLATSRADINGVIRRHLNARKASFASMDKAVSETGMEYGGITPVGLPSTWPLLIDETATQLDYVLVGSGIRKSKLLIPGQMLTGLPNAVILVLAFP
jgi:prolyl-tRNA editing enzyme YbaK/EbsC (Cys-tRNA(Pro) deacylase)